MGDPHSHRAQAPARSSWWRSLPRGTKARLASYRKPGAGWRLLTPLVFTLAGGLFVASSISSRGTDLRPGRYADLADLAASRSDRIAELERDSARLQEQVDRLTRSLTGSGLDEANASVDRLRGPAGLQGVTGPGVTVTLNDAPERVLEDESGDLELKIVHEQDIQAVANAMWAGGAEAITVQGQRITSTTGIKCVGSSVLLQGVAYPPPYVISGIGEAGRILAALDDDAAVRRYLADAQVYQLGWDVDLEDELTFPAYDGPIDTEYAEPLVPPGRTG